MARIRTIKPEIFQSSEVMDCSMAERLLFVGCITQADDEGRGIADPRKFKGCVFPGDDDITVESVRGMFLELHKNRLIQLYRDKNQQLIYQLRKWKDHQRIDKPRRSLIDTPPPQDSSDSNPGTFSDDSMGIGSEGSDLKDGKDGSKRAVDNGDKSPNAEGAPARAIGPRPAGANQNGDLANGVQTSARQRAELAALGISADEIRRRVPDAETNGNPPGEEGRSAA